MKNYACFWCYLRYDEVYEQYSILYNKHIKEAAQQQITGIILSLSRVHVSDWAKLLTIARRKAGMIHHDDITRTVYKWFSERNIPHTHHTRLSIQFRDHLYDLTQVITTRTNNDDIHKFSRESYEKTM